MRIIPVLIMFIFFTLNGFGQGQDTRYQIRLKEQSFVPRENNLAGLERAITTSRNFSQETCFTYLQFYDLPGQDVLDELLRSGVHLIRYLSGNTYLARATNVSVNGLNLRGGTFGIRASFQLPDEVKVHPDLRQNVQENKTVATRIYFLEGVDLQSFSDWLEETQLPLLDDRLISKGWIDVRLNKEQILTIQSFPEILYIDYKPVDEVIRYEAETLERANVLTNSTGRNLHGEGVVIGVGDGGKIGLHKDFGERVTNFASFGYSTHATHVGGIIGGYPNLRPKQGSGIANRATLLSNNFSDIIIHTPDYIQDFEMVVTNNSYGSNLGNCILIGDYNSTSALLDQQMIDHPEILHVFSAGNDGNATCLPYPQGFATIAGGYQVSKNVLTVGSCDQSDGLSSFSARGPVHDGRIKPEIVAQGSSVNSTRPNNIYATGGGTSYSGPAIAGIAGLMIERYRQLNTGLNPGGDLVKALLCNTADDLGNSGPDYRWGFGRVNAKRAVEALENNQYEISSIGLGQTNTHFVNVPAGVSQLKIMLLWTDLPAIPYVHNALVNDLNLTLTTPSSETFLPWILNPMPNRVSDSAIRGIDHTNNYEQVTVDVPAAGTYQLEVNGFAVPIGTQNYVLTYDFVMDGIELTYPIGGEKFASNAGENIRWDAPQTNHAFTLEYSVDFGSSWITLDTDIPSNVRHYFWSPPFIESDSVLFRISENNTSHFSQQSTPLSIIARPTNFSASNICAGTVAFNWDSVAGANSYSLYTIFNGEMTEMKVTSATADTIFGLDESKTYWWSLSANHASGLNGRRLNAISTGPSSGVCNFDDDVKLVSIHSLQSGRQLTNTELTSNEFIEISVMNNGMSDISNIPVFYSIDGNVPVSDTVSAIMAMDTVKFTFTAPVDFSGPGLYHVVVWSSMPGDPVQVNDTISLTVKQVTNTPISLPFSVGFESTDKLSFIANVFAIPGIEFIDFITNSGRLRTFAGSGFVNGGNRALTLDAAEYSVVGENIVTLTLNMSSYDAAINDVRLNFSMMHHELVADNDSLDLIWIRGSDTSDWIVGYDLFDSYLESGVYLEELLGIEVSNLLFAEGQNFSSSFQIRFGQEGNAQSDEPKSQDGYTIDDIELYEASNDLQLIQVLSPFQTGCGLSNEQIVVQVRNASPNSLSNINAHYIVDGSPVVSEVLGTLAPGQILDYTFTTLGDLSTLGVHNIDFWVSQNLDSYNLNDSILQYKVKHFPAIDQFPYLETFEQGPAGWIADGLNNSWIWGSPVNQIINHAAKGTRSWVTGLDGAHNANEKSYLYSPCFDISTLVQPAISFAHIYLLENNYDYSWVEYSIDDGITWDTLGTYGSGVNWYNDASANAWDNFDSKWHTATINLPSSSSIQIRFVMSSDVGLQNEGVAIDNFYVYDRAPIYTGPDTSEVIVVSGTDWVDVMNGGNHVVSIHPSGQDLGIVTVDVFQYSGYVRNTGNAFLLNRNWVLNATEEFVENVGLRLYFTDAEAEALLGANDCVDCLSPDDAFRFTVYKYDGINQDNVWSNNVLDEAFSFPLDSVRLVPYDSGYYAEVWLDQFSEFWISSVPTLYSDSVCLQVSANTDDAEEHLVTGAMDPYSEVLEITQTDTNQIIGLRFPGAQIPKGSYITSANLHFTVIEPSSGASEVLISGLSTGSSVGSFNTSNYNITSRNKTGIHVPWSILPWLSLNESGPAQISPDVSLLVQEAVNGNLWTPGNALGFMITGSGLRKAYSFDSSLKMAAKLVIEYDSVCSRSGRIYVAQDATGTYDGSSWTDAFSSLQEALIVASSCPDIAEIWVKRGTYLTSLIDDRSQSFQLERGLIIMGGFDGTEAHPDDRDLVNNISFLDGDIGVQGDSIDNAFHIFIAGSDIDTIIMDGFHFVNALANGSGIFENLAGGLYNSGKLHLRNVVFDKINGDSDGFIILSFLTGAEIIIENCELRLNGPTTLSPIYNLSDSQMHFYGNTIIHK